MAVGQLTSNRFVVAALSEIGALFGYTSRISQKRDHGFIIGARCATQKKSTHRCRTLLRTSAQNSSKTLPAKRPTKPSAHWPSAKLTELSLSGRHAFAMRFSP